MSQTRFTPYVDNIADEDGIVYPAPTVRCSECRAFVRQENAVRGTCDSCFRKTHRFMLQEGSLESTIKVNTRKPRISRNRPCKGCYKTLLTVEVGIYDYCHNCRKVMRGEKR